MKQFLLIFSVFIVFISSDIFPQSKIKLNKRIVIEGSYINNIGKFNDTWSTAAGGYISYGITVTEFYHLYFRSGFIKNKLVKNITADEGSLVEIPIEIGVKYYFWDEEIMPYVQFVNGLNLVFENLNLRREHKKSTLIKYIWQVGGGITYSLTDIVLLDFSANYQSNFYQTDAMNTGFEFTFGVGLMF
ncbi:MAG: hypothetical protein HND52_12590 [Ignavibacteriae bacterium]|nr:hypothetical protein [Ignavibacteriota bacterium]NOG98789.1 hypothetical protein [Ignavibacteriota bacterium]